MHRGVLSVLSVFMFLVVTPLSLAGEVVPPVAGESRQSRQPRRPHPRPRRETPEQKQQRCEHCQVQINEARRCYLGIPDFLRSHPRCGGCELTLPCYTDMLNAPKGGEGSGAAEE